MAAARYAALTAGSATPQLSGAVTPQAPAAATYKTVYAAGGQTYAAGGQTYSYSPTAQVVRVPSFVPAPAVEYVTAAPATVDAAVPTTVAAPAAATTAPAVTPPPPMPPNFGAMAEPQVPQSLVQGLPDPSAISTQRAA